MNSTTELYLAIPLGVLRRFVQMNEDKEDSWAQLFEINPAFVYTRKQLEDNGALEERGSVLVDLDKLYGGQNDK